MEFALGLGLGILCSFMIDFAAKKYIRTKLKVMRAYTKDLEKEYINLCLMYKYSKESIRFLINLHDFVYSDPYFLEEYKLYTKNKLNDKSEIDNLEKFMNQQQKEKK